MIDRDDRIVIGPPSPLTDCLFDVLQALAGKEQWGPEIRSIAHREIIQASSRSHHGRLLLCPFPTSQVIDWLQEANPRLVYLAQPPTQTVDHFRTKGRSKLEAIRIATACYVANRAIRCVQGAMILDLRTDVSCIDLLQQLCQYLSINVVAADFAKLTSGVLKEQALFEPLSHALTTRARSSETIDAGNDPYSDHELAILTSAILEPLATLPMARLPGAIVWPGCAFYSAEQPTERAPEVVNLVGPARMLYHGPFLHLPPGDYTVEIIVAVTHHSTDSSFRLEVHSGATCLARVRFCPKGSGGFSGRFAIAHADGSQELQCQLITERAAIEGEISLVQIAFHIMPDSAPLQPALVKG